MNDPDVDKKTFQAHQHFLAGTGSFYEAIKFCEIPLIRTKTSRDAFNLIRQQSNKNQMKPFRFPGKRGGVKRDRVWR